LQLFLIKGPPFFMRESSRHFGEMLGGLLVALHLAESDLPKLGIQIQDSDRFDCAMTLLIVEVTAWRNSALGIKQQKPLGILDIGFDEINWRVRTAAILVVAAGATSVTGTKEVIPAKGPLRISATLSKVFDVPISLGETRLAVGAAAALHCLKFVPYRTALLQTWDALPPCILAMAVFAQSYWRDRIAIQFMHLVASLVGERKATFEFLKADHPLTFTHHWVVFSKVLYQLFVKACALPALV
jgi:hypothetical protein